MMRMMAGLHASWWGSAGLSDYSFLGREDDFVQRAAALLPERVLPFLERFGDHIEPSLREVYEAMPGRLDGAVKSLLTSPLTLIHRDRSLKNTLTGGTPEAPLFVVIDWQRCSIGRGIRDVSFFIESSVRADSWRDRSELLEYYHSELTRQGVTDYSFDDLFEDCRLSTLCDLAQGVVMGTTLLTPEAAAIIRNKVTRQRGVADQLHLKELLTR